MAKSSNPNLKRAHEQHEYSPDHIAEIRKCAASAEYFIDTYCQIQHPVQGSIRFALRPYQKRIVAALAGNRLSIVLAPRQIGKALPLSTEIPTPTGWTTMSNINVGDYVLGANGKPTQVVAATEVMKDRPCYEVEFSTGEKIVCDANHDWTVTDISGGGPTHQYGSKTVTLTTEQLYNRSLHISTKQGKYRQYNFSVQVAKPLDLPDADLPLAPYVLGAWLGDGTSSAPDITNYIDDREIIAHCEELGLTTRTYESTRGSNTLRVYFRGLHALLEKCGVLYNKHIPISYLRASYEQRLELMRGLMDTDGTVTKTGGCELTLANKRLADDAFELVCSLGLKPTIIKRCVKGFTRYTITFKPFSSNIQPFRLTRKAERVQYQPAATRTRSTFKREIVNIVPVESQAVRCIQVDAADHLYLVTRSMIPTHNSWIAGAFLLWYAMFHFEKTVLVASNKNDNAMEMIHRCKFMYEHVPHWLKCGLMDDGWNKHSLSFDNGSRIISQATSENTGRGLSISLLFLDEFAFVRDSIAEEFWTSVSPTLATGGSCIICSTPNGDTNRFAQLWRGANIPSTDNPTIGINGFCPVEVKWNEPPGRDKKFMEEEIGKIGETRWKQEYECVRGKETVELLTDSGEIITTSLAELFIRLSSEKIITSD